MTDTNRQLKELFERANLAVLGELDERILTMLSTLGEPQPAIASLIVGGKGFQLRSFQLITIPSSQREEVIALLLDANHRYKLVKFALDESSGEVIAFVDVYSDPSSLTRRQVQRVATALESIAGRVRNRLAEFVRTGKDPGDQDNTDLLVGLLASLAEEAAKAKRASSASATEDQPFTPRASLPAGDNRPDEAKLGGGKRAIDALLDDLIAKK